MSFSVISRTPITAPDADGSKVPPVNTRGANGLTIGTRSLAGGSSITFRIISCDAAGNVQGVSPPCTRTAGAVADWGTEFLGTPTTAWDVALTPIQADQVFIKVDAVTGSWTLCASPQYPVGQTQPLN